MPRCAAAVSHGRLLRAVPRRRQDGRPDARPRPDQPREGRERHPHGRLPAPSAGQLPGQADRGRACGWPSATRSKTPSRPRGWSAARSPGSSRPARSPTRPCSIPRQSNYLAAVAPGRSGRAGLGRAVHRRFVAAGFPAERAGRPARPDRPGRVPAGRRRRAAARTISTSG